jgi:hypothetical protein
MAGQNACDVVGWRFLRNLRTESRSGSAPLIKKVLQQNLRGKFVHPSFSLLLCHLASQQEILGMCGRESFVMEANRQIRDLVQPFAKRPRFTRLLTFIPTHVNRQSDDHSDRMIFVDHFGKESLIALFALSLMVAQRAGYSLITITYCDSHAPGTVIDPKQHASDWQWVGFRYWRDIHGADLFGRVVLREASNDNRDHERLNWVARKSHFLCCKGQRLHLAFGRGEGRQGFRAHRARLQVRYS